MCDWLTWTDVANIGALIFLLSMWTQAWRDTE